jgi:steroid 5-alpha reductase family enzyme
METLFSVLLPNLALAALAMSATWVVSVRLRDAGIVDILWGATGALIAVGAFLLSDGALPRKVLVTSMTVIWGCRLALHVGMRGRGKGEDFRYAAMRAERPHTFPLRSLFTVFLFQALLIWIVCLPTQMAQVPPVPTDLNWLDYLGLAVWILGFWVETTADRQLRDFLADPANRGKVMDRGLWRYSRHPNYFGDSMIWWGIFLVAAATGAWWTIVSPILMTVFLMRISGVPLLEKALADRREGYREYMERTSSFFPWPPKKRTG